MKTFVRTLSSLYNGRMLWHDIREKEALRRYLNSIGFYVLTGTGDSLDAYVIPDNKLSDEVTSKWKTLDELNSDWYDRNGELK